VKAVAAPKERSDVPQGADVPGEEGDVTLHFCSVP
jgi:hypothetical protein